MKRRRRWPDALSTLSLSTMRLASTSSAKRRSITCSIDLDLRNSLTRELSEALSPSYTLGCTTHPCNGSSSRGSSRQQSSTNNQTHPNPSSISAASALAPRATKSNIRDAHNARSASTVASNASVVTGARATSMNASSLQLRTQLKQSDDKKSYQTKKRAPEISLLT